MSLLAADEDDVGGPQGRRCETSSWGALWRRPGWQSSVALVAAGCCLLAAAALALAGLAPRAVSAPSRGSPGSIAADSAAAAARRAMLEASRSGFIALSDAGGDEDKEHGEDSKEEDESEGEPAGSFIRWKEHPSRCLDVWGDHAGAMVQIWDCDDFKGADVKEAKQFKWLVPEVGEVGMIRWAGDDSLCLNAPGGNKIQLWYCATAPVPHTRWKIDSDGHIRLAHKQSMCLDIPDGHKTQEDGVKLQLWDCMEDAPAKEGNVLFDAYPHDCEWADWSDWSECSVSCDGGTRFRGRKFAKEASNGGKVCEGDATMTSEDQCNTNPCRTTTETTTTTTTPAAGGGGFFFR